MAFRHRSNTSVSARNSQRPDSRASTTSAASYHDTQSQYIPDLRSANPEAALLQYHHANMGPPHPDQNYDQAHAQMPQQLHHHSHSASFPMPNGYGTQDSLFTADQDQAYPQPPSRLGSVPVQLGADQSDDKKRKGSAVTATNDRELREMLVKNENRPLKDVAQEVIQKERTPMAEKTKQLFAMLWLRVVCKPAKTSVPRNRVYSQYANRCGTERVVPLNPASFGKLVRVIFPGIQTRRLGVRGESKYHYVDLALEEESPAPYVQQSMAPVAFSESDSRLHRSQSVNTPQIDFNSVPRLQADTAAFPPIDGNFDIEHSSAPAPRGPPSNGRTFAYPDYRGLHPNSAEGITYPHTLRFPARNAPAFSENEPVSLPSLHPYLPPRTDIDTAEALSALYRTHCTSLIDSIRFCKEKQFFRLYTSFHGTLTVPVQKLFTHPNLAPWIEECDLVMYRTMVRFVSRLTLQAAPVVVINIFQNISMNLHGHIMKTFAAQPSHVLEAKLRPATVFAGLLHRLIRVNQSAHAAANLLTIDQNREQMWREWVTMVNPKRVMEAELPDCGYEEVYSILTNEMRSLLEPLQAPAYHDEGFGYHQAYIDNGGFAKFLQNRTTSFSRHGESNVSTDTVLDRWSAFISSLPSRFPQAPARTLLHCISAIGTAALRDITIMNGQSYGHWWVLKIFVDEMSLWTAEMGGFLEPATTQESSVNNSSKVQSPLLQNENGRSHDSSRVGSAGGDGSVPTANGFGGHAHGPPSNGTMIPQSYGYSTGAAYDTLRSHRPQYAPCQQPTPEMQQHPYQLHGLPFQTTDPQKQNPQPETDIDDSGIGMSLVDDDLTMSKYDTTGTHVGMPAATEATLGRS